MIMLSAFFIQKVFRKYISTIPVALLGIGLAGVGGCSRGNIAPWHFIFALLIFIFGGVAAITSFKIVHSPLRYIFIFLGIIALAFLVFFKDFQQASRQRWSRKMAILSYCILAYGHGDLFAGYQGWSREYPSGKLKQSIA